MNKSQPVTDLKGHSSCRRIVLIRFLEWLFVMHMMSLLPLAGKDITLWDDEAVKLRPKVLEEIEIKVGVLS